MIDSFDCCWFVPLLWFGHALVNWTLVLAWTWRRLDTLLVVFALFLCRVRCSGRVARRACGARRGGEKARKEGKPMALLTACCNSLPSQLPSSPTTFYTFHDLTGGEEKKKKKSQQTRWKENLLPQTMPFPMAKRRKTVADLFTDWNPSCLLALLCVYLPSLRVLYYSVWLTY